MIKHFIAISSLYSRGQRIAWHYAAERLDFDLIQDFMNKLQREHDGIQIGIHRVTTNSVAWESVVSTDAYFKDIVIVDKHEDFISLIGDDQELNAMDIAKYILSIHPMSHLKLQKIIYLSYEKLLKTTNIKLFQDDIYAWKHGPVIKSVYDAFKEYGSSTIPSEEDDSVKIYSSELTVTPSFMKLISAELGRESLKVIHNVLKEYGEYTAWELVDVTHQEGKPWDMVYEENKNHLISDEVILKYT